MLTIANGNAGSFGLVICEAMYCGVPVIASGSGAQREIIDDGESGFIVDPLNEHTLQQAMEHVMSDAVTCQISSQRHDKLWNNDSLLIV